MNTETIEVQTQISRRVASGLNTRGLFSNSSSSSTSSFSVSATNSKKSSYEPKTKIEELERENKIMEDRLAALKEHLLKEKEKRGSAESIWKGGKSSRGSLKAYATEILEAKRLAKQKGRYTGITNEAKIELRNFESVAERKLTKLNQLHSQNTGDKGLKLPLILTADSSSQLTDSLKELDSAIIDSTKREKIIIAKVFKSKNGTTSNRSFSPENQSTIQMVRIHIEEIEWQVPSRPETPNHRQSSSLLTSLNKWSNAASITTILNSPIPIPPSNSSGSTQELHRVRRSRIRQINPPPPIITNFNANSSIIAQPSDFNEYDRHIGQGKSSEINSENISETPGGKLLVGEFDENAGRGSFLQALEEWRGGSAVNKTLVVTTPKKKEIEESVGTSTLESFREIENSLATSKIMKSTLEMLQSTKVTSLSYLEKMLLTKLREEMIRPTPQVFIASHSLGKNDEDEIEDEIAHVFWPPQLSKTSESDLIPPIVLTQVEESISIQIISTQLDSSDKFDYVVENIVVVEPDD
ncbi:hypothetical protein HK100_004986 [Physocladia obscura]|uniref:Uncharacterized protein n=1 Tax=Physocladia obscura TaxID=109957 RepID=A0AAD5XJE0_9FUNG|nr:hypothetical protein HK100_004986 [Physocladia obscura]